MPTPMVSAPCRASAGDEAGMPAKMTPTASALMPTVIA